MLYVAIYLLMLLAAGMAGQSPARRRAMYGFLVVFLFLFVAFRYEVGCDWPGYFSIYQGAGLRDFESLFQLREPLFMVANGLLHSFGLDYPYINVISSLVFFVGFHLFARRQPDPLGMLILCFPLLILHLVMSGIRQAMAIGIICVALNAFNDRRPLLYAGLVVLAAGFHTSALIFLAMTPLVVGEFSRRNVAAAAVVALPGLFFVASGEQFTIYYDRYVGSSLDAVGAPFRTSFLTLTGLLFVLLMKRRWQRLFPVDFKLAWISAMIMLPLFPLAFVSSVIADRVAYYLMPAQIMILARFAYVNRGMFSPVILYMPFIASGAVLVGWIALSGHYEQCYVPYQWWPLVQ